MSQRFNAFGGGATPAPPTPTPKAKPKAKRQAKPKENRKQRQARKTLSLTIENTNPGETPATSPTPTTSTPKPITLRVENSNPNPAAHEDPKLTAPTTATSPAPKSTPSTEAGPVAATVDWDSLPAFARTAIAYPLGPPPLAKKMAGRCRKIAIAHGVAPDEWDKALTGKCSLSLTVVPRDEGSAWMPLSIAIRPSPYGFPEVCVDHYYIQNGDLMYDPEIRFLVMPGDLGWWLPHSYTQHGLGIYQEFISANEKLTRGAKKCQVFADQTWAQNLREQDFDDTDHFTRQA